MAAFPEARAFQAFMLTQKASTILPNGIIYTNTTGISGVTVPKGVLYYNSTNDKLYCGIGTTSATALD